MDLLLCYRQEIARLVKEGDTYQDISSVLENRHPTERGRASLREMSTDSAVLMEYITVVASLTGSWTW